MRLRKLQMKMWRPQAPLQIETRHLHHHRQVAKLQRPLLLTQIQPQTETGWMSAMTASWRLGRLRKSRRQKQMTSTLQAQG